MKTIGVRDLQKRIKECVDTSQEESVVITRNGRPASVVIGVEGSDWEDIVFQSDPAFWATLRERRSQKSISSADMRKRVLSPARKKTTKKRRTRASS
jgi:prevent-host-death family protein